MERDLMRRKFSFLICVLPYLLVSSSAAQLPPAKNPLDPAQASAACSTTDTSSCAQVAAKLLPVVMGPSPLEENLRRLTDEIGGRVTGSPEMAKAVEWGVAAFRAAGIDVHNEKFMLPVTWSEGYTRLVLLGPLPKRNAPRNGVILNSLPGFPAVSEAWGPATPKG